MNKFNKYIMPILLAPVYALFCVVTLYLGVVSFIIYMIKPQVDKRSKFISWWDNLKGVVEYLFEM